MSLKKKFRQIKKLPTWVFIPAVLLMKTMKLFMRTEVHDLCGSIDPDKFPYISVTWHNRLLLFPVVFPKAILRRTAALISASRDGQYIADVAHLCGLKTVRGSSSRRGAIALKGAIEALEQGINVGITPDGPRGPRYRMSRGPVILASKTGRPVLPVSINFSSYWELKSWDRFQIPKPWAKLTLVIGEPVEIPPDLTDEEINEWRRILEQKLNAISETGE